MFFKNAFKIQLSTYKTPSVSRDFPGSSDSNESGCNVGDLGSIPGLGQSPGEGNGYPLQYPGLENSTDCIVHGVAKNQAQLSNSHLLYSRVPTMSKAWSLPSEAHTLVGRQT